MADPTNTTLEDRISRQEVAAAALTANVQNITEDLREFSRATSKAINDMGMGFRSELTSFRDSVEKSMGSVQNRDIERGKGLLPMVLTLAIGGFSVFATVTTIYISAQVGPVNAHAIAQDKVVADLQVQVQDSRDRGIRNETIIQLSRPRITFDAVQGPSMTPNSTTKGTP